MLFLPKFSPINFSIHQGVFSTTVITVICLMIIFYFLLYFCFYYLEFYCKKELSLLSHLFVYVVIYSYVDPWIFRLFCKL